MRSTRPISWRYLSNDAVSRLVTCLVILSCLIRVVEIRVPHRLNGQERQKVRPNFGFNLRSWALQDEVPDRYVGRHGLCDLFDLLGLREVDARRSLQVWEATPCG